MWSTWTTWSMWSTWTMWKMWTMWSTWSAWSTWTTWSMWSTWTMWTMWTTWSTWTTWSMLTTYTMRSTWATWTAWSTWPMWTTWTTWSTCSMWTHMVHADHVAHVVHMVHMVHVDHMDHVVHVDHVDRVVHVDRMVHMVHVVHVDLVDQVDHMVYVICMDHVDHVSHVVHVVHVDHVDHAVHVDHMDHVVHMDHVDHVDLAVHMIHVVHMDHVDHVDHVAHVVHVYIYIYIYICIYIYIYTLSHYRVSQTWIQAHLDTLITNKVRRWLDLPPSATAHFLPLPAKWVGLDLVLPSMLAEVCQLNTALALRHSGDPKMAPLQELGGVRTPFKYLLGLASKRKAMEAAKAAQITKHLGQLDGLQIQSVLLKALRVSLTATELTNWSTHIALISPTMANFARKALIRCLPTNSNLHRWGKAPSDSCPNCGAPETENHVLSNCGTAAHQGRYTWNHNAVLKMLATHIQTHLPATDSLYVDLPGFKNPSDIYTSILPDITVVRRGRASILELTCCYEKNVEASRQYKLNKYKNPSASSTLGVDFSVHTAEVTCLGFVPTTDLTSFCREAGIPPIPPQTVRRMGEMSLRCSFYIFCSRHKKWPENLTEPYFH